MERFFNLKIKLVQTDWGGEYCTLSNFFWKLWIFTSCVLSSYSPTKWCSWMQTLPCSRNWPFTFISNQSSILFMEWCLPNGMLLNQLTPHEITPQSFAFWKLFTTSYDHSFLKIFSYAPNLCPYNTHKLQSRSLQCVFLGYSLMRKGYKCFHTCIFLVMFSLRSLSFLLQNLHSKSLFLPQLHFLQDFLFHWYNLQLLGLAHQNLLRPMTQA